MHLNSYHLCISPPWVSICQEDECHSFVTSGVARVAELAGQAGGKGLHQGGEHIREARRADAISEGGLGAA